MLFDPWTGLIIMTALPGIPLLMGWLYCVAVFWKGIR